MPQKDKLFLDVFPNLQLEEKLSDPLLQQLDHILRGLPCPGLPSLNGAERDLISFCKLALGIP